MRMQATNYCISRIAILSLLFCTLLPFSWSQVAPLRTDPATTGRTTDKAAETKNATENASKSGGKSYTDIIKPDMIGDEGLFTIHQAEGKLYYTIPDSLLGVDMLLVSRIRQTPPNFSPFLNAGSSVNEQVVRWDRQQDKILLRAISYANVADESLPIYQSVQYNNAAPILQAFKILAPTPDSTGVLIEVTSMFTKDIGALSGLDANLRRTYKVSRLDNERSFIDTARSFPINIEVIHTMTYDAAEPPGNRSSGTLTMQMNQSMILLPRNPMMPRLHDERVGWFTVSQIDYSSEALKSDEKRYLRRWRLEPKDPAAYARGELVEPVKPIIYYLDPATPAKWRPYFKKGVEDWQAMFEAAGFKNAIIAKDPPTREEDPDFSPEDARYSTVRYVASTTRNAVGPSVSDPRTGEIIESDIIWYHNHLRSYRNRYLLETGAANPKVQSLDTPEEEIGEMMRRVIAHEIGHALGLPHNMKASSAYPVDSLRSPTFSQQYGIATTIMDYARFNYVAQPGDGAVRFIRQMGPYDEYAIRWGYRLVPGAGTPEAELPVLRQWIKEKEGDPRYMFGSGSGGIDPTAQTECIGDDNVLASTYGMANLQRVAGKLVAWTTNPGEDYTDLEELYGEMLGVWSRLIGHVVPNVGGVIQVYKTADQAGAVHTPVPAAKQREALQWLLQNAFQTPEWLLDADLLRRIESAGALERIRATQAGHLNNLLDPGRMQRLIEGQYVDGKAFGLGTFMKQLTQGLWSELYARQAVSVGRRALQRAYLERLAFLLQEDPPETPVGFGTRTRVNISQSDIRMEARAQLEELLQQLRRTVRSTADQETRRHWADCQARIEGLVEED